MTDTSIEVIDRRTGFGMTLAPAAGTATALGPRVADFVVLLKPRVMSLVVFTGFVGLYLAPGHLHPLQAAVAILCIAVGAGASGAINMWYERDLDARMNRTRRRPLPDGRMEPGSALGFGAVLAGASVALMGLALNWTAAALLALTIGFYVFVYTIWLKRRTPQNIVIGGAAGAFPPMVGWAAATGDIGAVAVALFAIIFLWTPPHFWALALYRNEDYTRAGIPMLPVVAGPAETKRQILLYAAFLIPVTLAPYLLGAVSVYYAVGAGILGLAFVGMALWVFFDRGFDRRFRAARALFAYSIVYLFLLFALLTADHALAPMLAGAGHGL